MWTNLPNGLQGRTYPSYQAYLAHQGAKLTRLSADKLAARDQRLMAALRLRLPRPPLESSPMVLCLGARTGAEVQVFRALGYRAYGLDVRPGSAAVFPGDFHAIPCREASIDLLFTNALDHAYDLARILTECRRVLKRHGILWLEVVRGDVAVGAYESLAWPSINALLSVIESCGWVCQQRLAFESPWPGEAVVCQ